jgi:hypothetical protein
MLCYDNSSSAASANALDGSSAHSIVWNHQLHIAGFASDSTTMVAVFVAVVVVLWLFYDEKKQLGNICPYQDLPCPFKDAQRRSRRDYMDVRPQMIGAKAP